MATHLNDFLEAVSVTHKETLSGFHELLAQTKSDAHSAVCFDCGEANSIRELALIPQLVRLPYRVCWLEFTHAEAPRVVSGVLASEKVEGTVAMRAFSRVGGHWYFAGGGARIAGEGNFYVMRGGYEDISIAMLHHVARFLSALNCTNVRRVEHKPDAKLQRARARRGKLPLFSYWTLELDLSRPESSESLGGSHASPRIHLRRGHPRQYAPEKWCWVQPHIVGNKALGVVQKDYKVAA